MEERLISLLFDIIKGLSVASITALFAFWFTKRYFSKITFANSLSKTGVNSFTIKQPSDNQLWKMFDGATVVRIIFVSGKTFFIKKRQMIEKAAKNGTRFEILLATKNSPFLSEIEEMERSKNYREKGKFITDELEEVENIFKEIIENDPSLADKFEIRHFNDGYRMPLILSEREYEKNHYRNFVRDCLLYISLPPYQTKHMSAILKLHADTAKYDEDDFNMIEMAREHFISLWERESDYEHWQGRKQIAKDNMEKCAENSGVLIEVAAQHPLKEGKYPAAEFSARLDAAIELYLKMKADKKFVKIYVPGSVHHFNGISDEISLSEAGKNYLIEKGVDSADIFADEMNEKYMKDDGVYNSADECRVASQIFFDDKYCKLISVCSATQFMRKKFLYLEFGIIADFVPIAENDKYHDVVDEFFLSLTNVVYDDHAWDKDSFHYKRTRKDRK